MKITPALEYDKLRDADSLNKIFLHKDGKFYHVYEWSAWLLKTIACTEEMQQERGDAKMLQVNRYNTKSGEYVMAGFPIESISKYVPEYDKMEDLTDGDLSVSITLSDEMQEMTFEQLQEMFEEWKAAQPLKETKKSNKEIHNGNAQAPALARSGAFSILSEVLAYPVEMKTPAENIEFISQIKQRIVALL